MSLPLILADQRMAERRGIKAVIFGKSGIGKTSLLMTLDPSTTLFIDLEAGDLAVEQWPGDTIRPRTWEECRDLAVFIGGPNPALRDDQAYSAAHFASVAGQQENFMPNPAKTPTTPVVMRDNPKLDEGKFCDWIANALGGDEIIYHDGFLMRDRSEKGELPLRERQRVNSVARRALIANELGLLHLVSRKVGPCRFEYIAVRSHAISRTPVDGGRV